MRAGVIDRRAGAAARPRQPGAGKSARLLLRTHGRALPGRLRTGEDAMRIVLFCHSLLSDWNHGNAHFLRGVVSELGVRGHQVRAFEPRDAWSLQNLLRDHGTEPLEEVRRVYPSLSPIRYEEASLDLDRALEGA